MEESAILSASNTETEAPSQSSSTAVPGSSISPHSSLHSYFNVMPGDMDQELALEKVWKYASEQAGSEDRDTVLNKVASLKALLGNQGYGDKPWAKMVAYIAARENLKSAESEIRSLTI